MGGISDILKRGATVFYPAHGVAKVQGVEEREFGGVTQKFFVLELARGGKSLVPVDNVEHAGLRPLISANKAKTLIKRMREVPEIDVSKSWKDRASKYSEGLKSGSADTYAQILLELMYRAKADKLSTTETKMLETARAYFVSEVGEVLDLAVEKIDKQLNDAIAFLLPDLEEPGFDDEEEEGEGESGDEDDGDDSGDDGDGDGDGGKKKAGKKKAGKKKAAKKKAGKKKAAKKKTAKKKPTTRSNKKKR